MIISNKQDCPLIINSNNWPATPKTPPTVGSPETSTTTTTTTTPDTDHLRSIKHLLQSTLQLLQFIKHLLRSIMPLLPPTNRLPLTSPFRLPLIRFTRTNRAWTWPRSFSYLFFRFVSLQDLCWDTLLLVTHSWIRLTPPLQVALRQRWLSHCLRAFFCPSSPLKMVFKSFKKLFEFYFYEKLTFLKNIIWPLIYCWII